MTKAAVGTFIAALATLGALSASCREPTSIVVEARTNVRPSEVGFAVGTPSEGDDLKVVAVTKSLAEGGDIGSLVVVPGSSETATVSIKVVAALIGSVDACTSRDGYFGCIVARRTIRYVPNERLRLPVFLSEACANVPCDAKSTCVEGQCVSSETPCDGATCSEPESAPPTDGGPPRPFDAEAPRDAALDAKKPVPIDGSVMPSGQIPFTVACPMSAPCPVPKAKCCLDSQQNKGACIEPAVPCSPPFYSVGCDGAEDCEPGFVCCVRGGIFACSESCIGANEVCKAGAKCSDIKQFCTGVVKYTPYMFCQ